MLLFLCSYREQCETICVDLNFGNMEFCSKLLQIASHRLGNDWEQGRKLWSQTVNSNWILCLDRTVPSAVELVWQESQPLPPMGPFRTRQRGYSALCLREYSTSVWRWKMWCCQSLHLWTRWLLNKMIWQKNPVFKQRCGRDTFWDQPLKMSREKQAFVRYKSQKFPWKKFRKFECQKIYRKNNV